MNLAVAKEIAPGESRVALIPETVKKLTGAGLKVQVEAGAGVRAGVNDSEEDADRLKHLLGPLRSKVNLIPFNEHPYVPFRRPTAERVRRFQQRVARSGLSVFVRTPRGDDISAACGQLGQEVDAPKRTLNVLP